jgi:uncharacterized lipoprotein NlpE involved in copper resistance
LPIEAALIKPVVDALLALFRQGNDIKLKRNADAALREAIRELLLANPDENKAEARIAIAKAAGILSEDVVLAEDMLKKTRASKSRTRGKSSTGRRRKPADGKTGKDAESGTRKKPTPGKAATSASGRMATGTTTAKKATKKPPPA